MNANTRSPALYACIGIFAAFIFAAIWVVAAQGDPSWVFGESMISDLGVSDVELTADLFMYGCIVTGLLAFIFGVGKAYTECGSNRLAGILVAIAGAFLVLVGLYNENFGNGNIHNTVAILFFLFLVLGMLASMVGDWAEGKRVNGAVTAVLIMVMIGVAVGKDLAYVESIAVICGLLWIFNASAKMILNVNGQAPVEA